MSKEKKIIDLNVSFVAETESALLVISETSAPKKIWIPKSQIEFDIQGVITYGRPAKGTITIPEWLAIKTELV